MKNTNHNVVSLSEFKQARGQLEFTDVEQFVKYQQDELRELDQDIASHLLGKRRLKDTEVMRAELAKINGRILEASDWLDDKFSAETDTSKTAAIEKLRKVTGQLVS